MLARRMYDLPDDASCCFTCPCMGQIQVYMGPSARSSSRSWRILVSTSVRAVYLVCCPINLSRRLRALHSVLPVAIGCRKSSFLLWFPNDCFHLDCISFWKKNERRLGWPLRHVRRWMRADICHRSWYLGPPCIAPPQNNPPKLYSDPGV